MTVGQEPSVRYELLGDWEQTRPPEAKGWVYRYQFKVLAGVERVQLRGIDFELPEGGVARANPQETRWYDVVKDGPDAFALRFREAVQLEPHSELKVGLELLHPEKNGGELCNVRAIGASAPNTVHAWNRSGDPVQLDLRGLTDEVAQISAGYAAVALSGGKVHAWSATGEAIPLEGKTTGFVHIAAQARAIMGISGDASKLHAWTSDGVVIPLAGDTTGVTQSAVAWSEADPFMSMIGGLRGGKVHAWDPLSGAVIPLAGETADVDHIVGSRNQIVGLRRGIVEAWDSSGSHHRPSDQPGDLTGITASYMSIAGLSGGNVYAWNPTGSRVELQGDTSGFTQVATSEWGSLIAGLKNGKVHAWTGASGTEVPLQGDATGITQIISGGSFLISGSFIAGLSDDKVHLWDYSGAVVALIEEPGITRIAASRVIVMGLAG
ncbi:hypothetical protein [Streptomyces sp. NPDC001678]|uniref:hypothetical protein n=1 Tax=Streptomyces sp. NPDC001678 TaxID=3364599 RepID=UPI0036CC910E